MKMYKIKLFTFDPWPHVVAVDVERKTKKSVWVKGRRYAIDSMTTPHFEKFEDAKEKLLSVAGNRVKHLRSELDKAVSRLVEIGKINSPD